MLKIRIIVLSVLFLLALNRCPEKITGNDVSRPLRELSAIEKKVTEADNNFGLKLFRQIAQTEGNKNIFISPLSVSMALGMAYNGADGETRREMHSMLEFGDLTVEEVNQSYRSLMDLLTTADPKVTFEIANSIWYRTGFSVLSEFLQLNANYFDAVIRALDFSRSDAADIINAWVNEKTHEKIPTIVESPIDPRIVMYLINAIYFKGTWTYEFDPEKTKEATFFLGDNSQTTCKMMSHKARHGYFADDQFQIADLTYGEIGFSMTVILPNEGVNVDSIATIMTAESWAEWTSRLVETDLNVFLPKFKTEYEIGLIPVLRALGMIQAFTTQANFTKINPDGNLLISEVKHKTFVDVNEEGTEAAAVTVIGFGRTSAGPQEIYFLVNRPFIFVLRENNTGTILFVGKIVNPNI
ncbi:MAG TPA: serpin family protein [Candidatus Marinimicrobia bacterium]|nr:serpin family protein [Candidatus Neomarinimicrobiota bacterium]